MNLPKPSKKALLLSSLPVAAAVAGIGIAVHPDTQTDQPKQLSTISQEPAQETPLENQKTPKQLQAQPTQKLQAENITEDEPTNPYPEGFNIWHVWNRRTAVGLETPTGAPSDVTWCRDLIYTKKYPTTSEPSLHAIVCLPNINGTVVGFVESVNEDGSITVSQTNGTSGWNHLMEKTIPANETSAYLYLQ